MTKNDIKEFIKGLGAEAGGIASEIYDKIEEEKSQLDTETRRKVRAFWAPVGFVLGFAAAYLVQWIM